MKRKPSDPSFMPAPATQPVVESKSVVDDQFPVSTDLWVASMLRKPTGTNPEHAFLVVEGMTPTGQIVLRRYDLFVDEKQVDKSLVNIKERTVDSKAVQRTFQADFLNQEEFYAMSWSITAQEAKGLHEDVLKEQKAPPDYFISGDQAVSGMVSKSTTNPGHNCFTWARERLRKVSDRIQMPDKLKDFIVAQTSVHLSAPRAAQGGCRIL